MKKWYLLIIGTIFAAATAQAHCGSCGAHAEEAKDKAACEMKAAGAQTACTAEKTECTAEKAECTADKAECTADKAECTAEKAECTAKGAASGVEKKCCGTCKGGKKWYNPVSWFK